MTIKLFEVRDRATAAFVMAISPETGDSREAWMLSRAGYGQEIQPGEYVMLMPLNGGVHTAQSDPFAWGDRTFFNAHMFIREHWNELISGEVIDIEFILGETTEPKVTEQPLRELVASFAAKQMAETIRSGK